MMSISFFQKSRRWTLDTTSDIPDLRIPNHLARNEMIKIIINCSGKLKNECIQDQVAFKQIIELSFTNCGYHFYSCTCKCASWAKSNASINLCCMLLLHVKIVKHLTTFSVRRWCSRPTKIQDDFGWRAQFCCHLLFVK